MNIQIRTKKEGELYIKRKNEINVCNAMNVSLFKFKGHLLNEFVKDR